MVLHLLKTPTSQALVAFLISFFLSRTRNVLFAVREDHTNEKDVINTVVAISLKDQSQHVLASGADFYSSPRVSSDGKHLCWVEWNHPNMASPPSFLSFFFSSSFLIPATSWFFSRPALGHHDPLGGRP